MRHAFRALMAAAGMLAVAAPASATITNIWGPPGEICILTQPCGGGFHYPVRQGRTIVLDIQGQFVDLSTSLAVSGSGVTVSTAGTSSSHRLIRVAVSSGATPGLRTVTLHYAVELNGPDRFQILVLRGGRVRSVPNPDPSAYFNDVTVAFNGTNLANAGVVVLPDKTGTFSVGGSQLPQVITLTQSTATGTVASSSDTQVNVRLHFNGGPFAEAKATVLLFDRQIAGSLCQQHRVFCYTGTDNSNGNGESTAHIIGPNAVSSITFPFGARVTLGSPITARIKLVRPAKATGETIVYEVVPSTSFNTAAGSGTRFDRTVRNSVHVPGGNGSSDVTLQLVGLPAGCAGSCSAQFKTRMVNFTVDQPPFLQIAEFTIASR